MGFVPTSSPNLFCLQKKSSPNFFSNRLVITIRAHHRLTCTSSPTSPAHRQSATFPLPTFHSSSPSPTPTEPKTSWPRRFASRRRKAEPVPVPATLIPSFPRRLSPSKKREPLGVAGEHAPPPFPAPSVRAVGEARASTPIRSALTARRRRIWEGREPGPAHPPALVCAGERQASPPQAWLRKTCALCILDTASFTKS